jgi:hypothetical protein
MGWTVALSVDRFNRQWLVAGGSHSVRIQVPINGILLPGRPFAFASLMAVVTQATFLVRHWKVFAAWAPGGNGRTRRLSGHHDVRSRSFWTAARMAVTRGAERASATGIVTQQMYRVGVIDRSNRDGRILTEGMTAG